MKKIVVLFIFLVGYAGGFGSLIAQEVQLSPKAELSVITCGPGTEELYASFGHSAFRVQDIPNKIDRIYNYGTFNFNTPNFYTKFVQGKLLYQLSAYDFGRFLQGYHHENRWVKGQVLDLTPNEVQQVYDYLENNALPQNRDYKYDFFYDNCSTKLYEVLETVLGDRLIFDNDFASNGYTQRELISQYTISQPWGDFGIDLALGANIDRKATAKEYMFLPDYVLDAFTRIRILNESEVEKLRAQNDEGAETLKSGADVGANVGADFGSDPDNQNQVDNEVEKSEVAGKLIVKRTEDILLSVEENTENDRITPLQVGGIFLLLCLFVTFLDHRKAKRSRIFDGMLFIATGLAGVVMLLLWFATDHTATVNNFNILWAFAPNLLFAFFLQKKPRMSYWYLFSLIILLDIMIGLWIFKVQVFHMAMVPIIAGLYVRYIYLWRYFRKWRSL